MPNHVIANFIFVGHIDICLCLEYTIHRQMSMCYKVNMVVIDLDKNYKEYAGFLKALGDETRVKIFDMLTQGEICACKLLAEFKITQPTLSYHMKILCESGLVSGRRDGVWMRYSINMENLNLLKNMFCNISDKVEDRKERITQ